MMGHPPTGIVHREAPLDAELRRDDCTITIRAEDVNAKARTARASISSDRPYKRWFGTEVLRHDAESVDLGRADGGGLMLLFGHDPARPLGRVRDLAFEGGRLVGELAFSESADAREIWPQVRDGWLREVSIGYRVHKWEVDEDDEIHTAIRWELLEASIVTVPADASVGVGRNDEGETVTKRTSDNAPTGSERGAGAGEVVDFTAVRESALADGQERGRRAVLQRNSEIGRIFTRYRSRGARFADLERDLLLSECSLDAAREALDALIADELTLDPGVGREHQVPATRGADDEQRSYHVRPRANGTAHRAEAGIDAIDRYGDAARDALAYRAGVVRDAERGELEQRLRANPLRGATLVEIAREYCRVGGIDVSGLDRLGLVGVACTRAVSHGTSDFPVLLVSTAEKALLMGWEQAGENWDRISRPGALSDFKAARRVGVGSFSDLLDLKNGEYQAGTIGEASASIQLATYGRKIGISRQAIVNDELGALGAVPMKMGEAANRKVGDLVWGLLTGNPTLDDGVAWFDAGHSNVAGAGAAIAVATVNAGIVAMATQKAPAPGPGETGATAQLALPVQLLCPWALRGTAIGIAGAEFDPADTEARVPNVVRDNFTVIAEARLDAHDAAQWYLCGDPRRHDVIEVAGLDGPPRAVIESQDSWNVDGVEYKVRLDAAAAPLDFRYVYRNAGD